MIFTNDSSLTVRSTIPGYNLKIYIAISIRDNRQENIPYEQCNPYRSTDQRNGLDALMLLDPDSPSIDSI